MLVRCIIDWNSFVFVRPSMKQHSFDTSHRTKWHTQSAVFSGLCCSCFCLLSVFYYFCINVVQSPVSYCVCCLPDHVHPNQTHKIGTTPAKKLTFWRKVNLLVWRTWPKNMNPAVRRSIISSTEKRCWRISGYRRKILTWKTNVENQRMNKWTQLW